MAKPIGIKHKIKGADNKAKQMPCAVAREHPIRSPRPQSWATNVLVIPAKAIKPHTNVKNKIPAGSDARNEASLYQERNRRIPPQPCTVYYHMCHHVLQRKWLKVKIFHLCLRL